ncbi:hypothetical protein BLNAU_16166 [Blattamonas nauphoetae]|uniref:Uncharacterized protein n=1 Tax=Blattamonas nauphoetae TaxID=2049346 RepID=A0ABQ9XCG1_9EUKA|nr:hypothetical protein BLNAU_16166 [Blattamonas nauphoetae]
MMQSPSLHSHEDYHKRLSDTDFDAARMVKQREQEKNQRILNARDAVSRKAQQNKHSQEHKDKPERSKHEKRKDIENRLKEMDLQKQAQAYMRRHELENKMLEQELEKRRMKKQFEKEMLLKQMKKEHEEKKKMDKAMQQYKEEQAAKQKQKEEHRKAEEQKRKEEKERRRRRKEREKRKEAERRKGAENKDIVRLQQQIQQLTSQIQLMSQAQPFTNPPQNQFPPPNAPSAFSAFPGAPTEAEVEVPDASVIDQYLQMISKLKKLSDPTMIEDETIDHDMAYGVRADPPPSYPTQDFQPQKPPSSMPSRVIPSDPITEFNPEKRDEYMKDIAGLNSLNLHRSQALNSASHYSREHSDDELYDESEDSLIEKPPPRKQKSPRKTKKTPALSSSPEDREKKLDEMWFNIQRDGVRSRWLSPHSQALHDKEKREEEEREKRKREKSLKKQNEAERRQREKDEEQRRKALEEELRQKEEQHTLDETEVDDTFLKEIRSRQRERENWRRASLSPDIRRSLQSAVARPREFGDVDEEEERRERAEQAARAAQLAKEAEQRRRQQEAERRKKELEEMQRRAQQRPDIVFSDAEAAIQKLRTPVFAQNDDSSSTTPKHSPPSSPESTQHEPPKKEESESSDEDDSSFLGMMSDGRRISAPMHEREQRQRMEMTSNSQSPPFRQAFPPQPQSFTPVTAPRNYSPQARQSLSRSTSPGNLSTREILQRISQVNSQTEHLYQQASRTFSQSPH